jgi:DNA-directed RNA polymerase specialized sigma24 family protein
MAKRADAFLAFAQLKRAKLRSIAFRTCGEHTLEDVMGEAWLIADRIGRKRGFDVDFGNAHDQEIVLAWLFNELVRFADKQTRYAVRLDKDWDQEDAGAAVEALSRFLIAPEAFDPAVAHELAQEQERRMAVIKHSYSQAAAYLILLERFTWDMDDLADHLKVVTGTLRGRIQRCAAWIRQQPSLFDRISAVEKDFAPFLARRVLSRRSFDELPSGQLVWVGRGWGEPAVGQAPKEPQQGCELPADW